MFLTKRGISAAMAEAIAETVVDAALATYTPTVSTTDAFVTIAAADTPSAQKSASDIQLTGTSLNRIDHTAINAAFASIAAAGGEVLFLPGTYYPGGTIHAVTSGVGGAAKPLTVRFLGGATIDADWTDDATDIVLSVESWNADIWNPTIRGGNRNDGIAIALGSDVATVHGVSVYSPRCSGVHTGVEIGVFGGANSGDNTVQGGYLSGCTYGIKNEGYTNTFIGTFINNCTTGFFGSDDNASAKASCYGLIINNSDDYAIDLARGAGYTFDSCWFEITDDTRTPAAVIRIGDGTNQCDNVRFTGVTNVHLQESPGTPEPYVVQIASGENFWMDHLQISTSGGVPSAAVLYQASTNTGKNNRIGRVTCKIAQTSVVPIGLFGTTYLTADTAANAGTLPVANTDMLPSSGTITLQGTVTTGTPRYQTDTIAYTGKTSTTLTGCTGGTGGRTYAKFGASVHLSRLAVSHASATGEVIVEGAPTVVGGDAALLAGQFQPDRAADYTMGVEGSTYVVKARNGHVVAVASECISPMNLVKGNDRTIRLLPGTFDQGTAWWKFSLHDHLTINGSGMGVTTVRNRFGDATVDDTDDTEPFDLYDCDYMVIRDLTVSAGGGADANASSDAIDGDACAYCLIERVEVIAAPASGIVFDGKDSTSNRAEYNTIRDCITTGCLSHGVKLLCTDHNVVINHHSYSNGSAGLSMDRNSGTSRRPLYNKVLGGRFTGNTGAGVLIDQGAHNLIDGATCMNNGTDGVRIRHNSGALNADYNRVVNCILADDQGTPTQDHGCRIGGTAANLNQNQIINNTFFANTTAAVTDGGTGTVDAGNLKL